MGAHNNPDGNCEPLAADGKESGEGIQMHHRALIHTLLQHCVQSLVKKKFVVHEWYRRCMTEYNQEMLSSCCFHAQGIKPMITGNILIVHKMNCYHGMGG